MPHVHLSIVIIWCKERIGLLTCDLSVSTALLLAGCGYTFIRDNASRSKGARAAAAYA